MNIPDYIIKNRELNASEKILLGYIRNMSRRKEGCTSRDERIASDTGMSSRSVSRIVKKLFDKEYIDVISDGKSRVIYFDSSRFECQRNDDNLSDKLTDTLVNRDDNLSKIDDNLSKNDDNLSVSYMEEPKGTNKEPIVGRDLTENSFSILKNDQDELVGFLLSKFRRRLVELLPKGSAEEIANGFANWWVAQGRSFTNTPKQRSWVEKSLPLWAEIEKPKNGTSDIRAIASEVWRRDFPDNEIRLISEKVIQENWGEPELRDFMAYTKRNLGSNHGRNTHNVFSTHFEKLKTQVA